MSRKSYYIIIILMAAALWRCSGKGTGKAKPPREQAPAASAVEPGDSGPVTLVVGPPEIPADGQSVAVAGVKGQGTSTTKFNWELLADDGKDSESAKGCVSMSIKDNRSIILSAGFKPCRVRLRALDPGGKLQPLETRFEVVQSFSDKDGDGIPDAVELTDPQDRDAFRAWFTAIADAQVDKPSPAWDPANRHCAGLIRFAFIEALKVHDGQALKRYPNVERKSKFDVGKYNYPAVPLLGAKVFRTVKGPFSEKDLKSGAFSEYIDARGLQEFNTAFVSKDINQALPGDILFFLHFDDPVMPYHSMIVAGETKDLGPYLVYHTGPVDNTEGRMKRVPMAKLMAWPDERWHPVPENNYFSGVYRFNILN